nr:DUF4271 domain-containing protein [uncultured Carboxylicivirga sp.]
MIQQDTTKVITPGNQLNVGEINISNTNQLRTPVLQIEDHTPRHLTQQQPVFARPKITYQQLTHKDSIYLNLIPAESDNIFDAELSFETELPSKETNLKELTPKIEVVKEEVAQIQPEEEQITVKDTVETITVQPLPNRIKIRSANQFEGSKDWLSGFIILAILIAGLVKLTSGKYLNDIFSSIRYQQSASKLFTTFNVQNQKPGWALSFLFILSTSLLIFEYTMVMGRQPENISHFYFLLVIFGGIIVYSFLKKTIYHFVGFVFDTTTDTKTYIFNAELLNKAFGISMLPIISVVPFVDQLTATFLLKAGLVLFVLMYLVQLLRGVKIILRSPLSIFYMFLYFCALEILPLAILIKIMIL